MLNLLFITDIPKAEHIKSALQPFLKVIIDVVTDFDHGLKDVFEKRPATVCIQDQIGGVTGESVARHIQMLLGKSAPSFILLHNGNDKAKTIKGLYEYLIDMSQSTDAVAEEIKITLKSLLGDQWQRIYIPPKFSTTPVKLKAPAPDVSREDADKLVDDFLLDLETSVFPIADGQTPVTSLPDKVVKLPSAAISTEKERKSENFPEKNDITTVQIDNNIPTEAPVPIPAKTSTQSLAPVTAPQPPLAAEFRVTQKLPLPEEDLPDGLLLAFEENYRSESPLLRRFVIVLLVSLISFSGVWYFIKQKPLLVNMLKQRFMPSSIAKQAPVDIPVDTPVQKPMSTALPQPAVTASLPAFVPANGLDSSYAVKNAGWERYVGKLNDFRIFSSSGRINAVQVLAVKDAPISESLIKTVLLQLTGSSEYRIISRNTKAGVRVENGMTKKNGEIVIYRKKGSVRAFVVSVN